jgi:hypothetical protein
MATIGPKPQRKVYRSRRIAAPTMEFDLKKILLIVLLSMKLSSCWVEMSARWKDSYGVGQTIW